MKIFCERILSELVALATHLKYISERFQLPSVLAEEIFVVQIFVVYMLIKKKKTQKNPKKTCAQTPSYEIFTHMVCNNSIKHF